MKLICFHLCGMSKSLKFHSLPCSYSYFFHVFFLSIVQANYSPVIFSGAFLSGASPWKILYLCFSRLVADCIKHKGCACKTNFKKCFFHFYSKNEWVIQFLIKNIVWKKKQLFSQLSFVCSFFLFFIALYWIEKCHLPVKLLHPGSCGRCNSVSVLTLCQQSSRPAAGEPQPARSFRSSRHAPDTSPNRSPVWWVPCDLKVSGIWCVKWGNDLNCALFEFLMMMTQPAARVIIWDQ